MQSILGHQKGGHGPRHILLYHVIMALREQHEIQNAVFYEVFYVHLTYRDVDHL